MNVSFSPDGAWITFQDVGPQQRERIVPLQGETMAPESAWYSTLAELAGWSPAGTVVYGASDLDGFNCIWAQRLDAATKRPVGSPVPIFHAHGARALTGGGSVARERLVFSLAERTGNIWMTQWNGSR